MRCWLLAICFLGGPALAALHEHGVTHASVALTSADQAGADQDGASLVIELRGPASNFLGFEHKPATPDETRELAQVLNTLRDGAALFLFPPEAHCHLNSVAVSPPAYTADGHGDLEAFWDFRCGSPAMLTWVEARIFDTFPGTERLATSAVTGTSQKSVVLTRGTTRLLMP